ncbi:MAG: HepT-like ribonuclease domain-containing protein [Rhodoglobus sp.]
MADEWHIVWATRNRIAHGYTYVDRSIIEATIANDLPLLEAALAAEVKRSLP